VSDRRQALVSRIDAAVRLGDPEPITRQIEHERQDAIRARAVSMPDRFRQARADHD
jgi:hypothetical protein